MEKNLQSKDSNEEIIHKTKKIKLSINSEL